MTHKCKGFTILPAKEVVNTKAQMTHNQWSEKAKPTVPCTCHHMTYGGRCLNCGYDPSLQVWPPPKASKTPQKTTKKPKLERNEP
jgi:hypothetical protein